MDNSETEVTPNGVNPFVPPTDPAELIPWLNRKKELGRRKLPELRMRMNLAYVLGHQWVVWDANRKQWARPKTDPDDPNAPIRLTINKVGTAVERAVAKLTKENVLPECRPASDDDDDVAAAKVGTRILSHEMDRLGWGYFLKSFMFWPVTLGWSYAHLAWDADAGVPIDLDPEGELRQGEITLTKVPAYEMGVDPSAQEWDQAKWCVRSISTTKEAVWERWGVMPVGAEYGRTILDEVNDLANAAGISGAQNNSKAHFVKVHQFWMKSGTRAAPKGLVVTWCGDTILEGPMPFPYNHGELPFVPCYLLPGLGEAAGRTWVDDVIPMQTDYNDARSREAQMRRTMTPKLLTPIGSVDPNRITSRVEIIPYANVNGKPEWVVPDTKWMSPQETGMHNSDEEIGERSGQAAHPLGGMSHVAAAAITAMLEYADIRMTISSTFMDAFVQGVGYQLLMLVKQYWTENRLIRTWSENGDMEAEQFSQADIAEAMDVHVQTGSSMPRSKAARTQLAMQLAPLGLIKDPKDLFKILDIDGTEFMMEHMNLDSKQAQRENTRLRMGTDCVVHPFDNHEVHLTEHNNYRKSQEYDDLPDNIRAVVDAHCDLHSALVNPQLAGPGVPGTNTVDASQLPPIAGRPDLAPPPGQQGTQPAAGKPMYASHQGSEPALQQAGGAPQRVPGQGGAPTPH